MTTSARILLLRFHALGDVVLSTGIASALGRGAPGSVPARVEVAVEARYVPIFRGNREVERIWTREEITRAAEDGERFDRVVDLQGTPGSRRLARTLGPATSLRARSAARRWVVLWGDRWPRPRIPHAIARYAEAAGLPGGGGGAAECRPVATVAPEEEAEARKLAPEAWDLAPGSAVALLTGASRRSKEYPPDAFAETARRLLRAGVPVWGFAPPAGDARPERDDRSTARGADWPAEAPLFRLPLGALKGVLARAALAVSSDSGPMHLATALGVPVLGVFGSSVPAFGFTPAGERDRVLAVETLACRPCGVHGRNHCWMGHWRCLRDLTPERVASAALEQLEACRRSGENLTGPVMEERAHER